MEYSERITLNPHVMGGKPCIRGMCVTVGKIVGLVATGVTDEKILQAYQYLEAADIPAAWDYAARQTTPPRHCPAMNGRSGRADANRPAGERVKALQ